ncbi:MAG TPA: ImcF-related family protein, partial [Terriglobia bacterium]|nr:ImcF-related family protein [Terriglobia bacterium]
MNKALKYIIAGICFVVWFILVWFAGSWMHLAGNQLWIFRIALWVIGLIALVIVVVLFRMRDKERAAQAAAGTAPGTDEIDILVREAETRLKASQLGPKARIDSMPLFFVVGESGAAKTTVVMNCGLEPELLAGQAMQEGVPVPTQALNLWYSRNFLFAEAGSPLLLDTSRWARLVKKLAPQRLHSIFGKGVPCPRAALVCIDAESFMAQGAAESLGAVAERLRTRLRDISQVLGISLPVYVLLTRADRLQFFQDYVRNLSNDEASLVFGATLPMVSYATGVYAEQETARVAASFDNLFQSLAEKRLPFLGRELDGTKWPAVYEFPREFGKLRSLLVRLLVDICRPSQLGAGPFLRGFYFTGVRPVVISTPVASRAQAAPSPQTYDAGEDVGATRMFDRRKMIQQAQQQAAAAEATESRRIPQWVFLPHLFNDVLLKDTSALDASVTSTKTSLWRRILLASAMAIFLLLIVAFVVSFARNRGLENEISAAAQDLSKTTLTGHDLASVGDLSRLEALREPLARLADYQENGHPWSMNWGLYIGKSLYPQARRIYFQNFQQLLFGQTQDALAQSLRALPLNPGPNDQYSPVYDALKAYLITTSNHDKSTVAFLSPVLMKTWAAGRDIDKPRSDLAQKQFDFYAEELFYDNPYSSVNDADTVAHSRHYLNQIVGEDQVYSLLLAEASKANPSFNFNNKFPGSAEVVVEPTTVEGAFTKAGWQYIHNILQDLPKYFSGEEWVMGAGSSSNLDLAKLAGGLERRYQQDYISKWRAFLRNARVQPYNNAADASQKLTKLTSNDTPLLALFCAAALNVSVGQADVQKAFQPVLLVEAASCQDQHQYITDSNKPYIGGLSGLQQCLDQAGSAPGPQADIKTACGDPATKAHAAAQQIGQGFTIDQDGHVDDIVQNLLYAPIVGATGMKPPPVGGKGLCSAFGALASVFPFNAVAKTDATLQDVDGFFNPTSGALSKFYNENLKNAVILQGTNYVPNPDATQKVSPVLLHFFNQAMAVQRALYSGPPGQVQYKYALRPHPTPSVTGLTMSLDGQPLTFMGGNASFQNYTWPGTGAPGLKLTVKMSGGSDFNWPPYEGTWGVFHFFAEADEFHLNGSTYTITSIPKVGGGRPMTTPDGKPVTVQFDLDTLGQSPLLQKGFLTG